MYEVNNLFNRKSFISHYPDLFKVNKPFNPIEVAKERIRKAFKEYGRLGLAWSGGKDSTTLLVLALEVLRETKGELAVLHNDTLVENPIIREHCDRVLEELRAYIKREDLPVEIYISKPHVNETFWVNVVGKGYPLANPHFRWCQKALKIKPSERTAEKIGVKAFLVGVREKESIGRKRLINKNYKNGKSERFKQVLIAPIVDWADEDVWEFLTTYECEWTNLRKVYELYRSASGECPVFYQERTTFCGARFGCWVCPLIKEVKEIKNMMIEYPQLKPLYELRNWLIEFCSRKENRTGKKRNGKPIREGKGQLTIEARKEIFKRLKEMNLLTEEEETEIKKEWQKEVEP